MTREAPNVYMMARKAHWRAHSRAEYPFMGRGTANEAQAACIGGTGAWRSESVGRRNGQRGNHCNPWYQNTYDLQLAVQDLDQGHM
jgi:hypothetical protein